MNRTWEAPVSFDLAQLELELSKAHESIDRAIAITRNDVLEPPAPWGRANTALRERKRVVATTRNVSYQSGVSFSAAFAVLYHQAHNVLGYNAAAESAKAGLSCHLDYVERRGDMCKLLEVAGDLLSEASLRSSRTLEEAIRQGQS